MHEDDFAGERHRENQWRRHRNAYKALNALPEEMPPGEMKITLELALELVDDMDRRPDNFHGRRPAEVIREIWDREDRDGHAA